VLRDPLRGASRLFRAADPKIDPAADACCCGPSYGLSGLIRRTEEDTMSATAWTRVAAGFALAGGLAWLAKQVAIAGAIGPDGAPPESGVIGTFYLLGVGLMLVGATGVGAWLLRGRPPLLWVPVAILLAPVVFFGVQAAADALVDALAGPDAHWWWTGEGGIVLTGLVFAGAGALVLTRSRRAARRLPVTA
jgi:hypothetical protein